MGTPKPDRGDGLTRLTDVTQPYLRYFPAPGQKAPGPAVILCPGGGYVSLVTTKMTPIAKWLNDHGVSAFILHSLCVGERMCGAARGMDDFAMLDVSTGLGLGIVSGGRLLTGNSGMAGELGHITVVADGERCGCGNRGCLETVATDTAFARLISKQLGRKVGVQESLAALAADGSEEVIEQTVDYLAIAVAAVINIFNPATLFLHGQLMNSAPAIFKRVLEKAKQRTLSPSFEDCRILQSQGNKRLGAVAGIIDHLANELAPAFASIDNGNVELS